MKSKWKRSMKVDLLRWRALEKLILCYHGFNISEFCKIKLEVVLRRTWKWESMEKDIMKMRREIAEHLESREYVLANIKVESIIIQGNMVVIYKLIEQFCSNVRRALYDTTLEQSECPFSLKEDICSLLFAARARRCPDMPELMHLKKLFKDKYGTDFVLEAMYCGPNSAVNRLLFESLSSRTEIPSLESKLQVLKDIVKEYEVEWRAVAEFEHEMLAPQERRLGNMETAAERGRFHLQCPSSQSSSLVLLP